MTTKITCLALGFLSATPIILTRHHQALRDHSSLVDQIAHLNYALDDAHYDILVLEANLDDKIKMIQTHQFSDKELADVLDYLKDLPPRDPRKLAVAKMCFAIKVLLDGRTYDRLPADHSARVDPDYPPNEFLAEIGE